MGLRGSAAWSQCQHGLNQTQCIGPAEIVSRCAKRDHIEVKITSAHLYYMQVEITYSIIHNSLAIRIRWSILSIVVVRWQNFLVDKMTVCKGHRKKIIV